MKIDLSCNGFFHLLGQIFFCSVSWNVVFKIFHFAVLTVIKDFFITVFFFTLPSHNIQSLFWGSAVPCLLIYWPCFLCIHNAHLCYKAAFIISTAGTHWNFLHQNLTYHAAELLSFLKKNCGWCHSLCVISISWCHDGHLNVVYSFMLPDGSFW